MSRFQCKYCKRILHKERKKSFKCISCGHGEMKLVKPKAHCIRCNDPIFDNVDLRPDKRSKEGYYVFCGNCTMAKVVGIKKIREEKT